ncbi:MAG: flagellar motor switch protein FliG [Planctomycetota bacterium]|jgi:flagellar motor switch protein FliG
MTNLDAVSGYQKVAAFLLSLDSGISAKVMRTLDPKVIPGVASAMTELTPELCTAAAVDQLYLDLARTVYQRKGVQSQDDHELHDILAQSYGEDNADNYLRDIHNRRRRDHPFGFLDQFKPEVVARVLGEESSSIVSLILAHSSPDVSAAVLDVFEEEQTLEIVKRMTAIQPPAIETMLGIADDLLLRMREADSIPAPPDPSDTLRTIADLLTHAQGTVEQTVLEGLADYEEDIAEKVREYMFSWEDLASIDKRAMQKILATVDTRSLSIALKASPPDVEANIMDNLSSRVKDMVVDERDLAGPMAMGEVQASRNEILSSVRALMDAGEFKPVRAGEELVN